VLEKNINSALPLICTEFSHPDICNLITCDWGIPYSYVGNFFFNYRLPWNLLHVVKFEFRISLRILWSVISWGHSTEWNLSKCPNRTTHSVTSTNLLLQTTRLDVIRYLQTTSRCPHFPCGVDSSNISRENRHCGTFICRFPDKPPIARSIATFPNTIDSFITPSPIGSSNSSKTGYALINSHCENLGWWLLLI
jgi:hypothetical protein